MFDIIQHSIWSVGVTYIAGILKAPNRSYVPIGWTIWGALYRETPWIWLEFSLHAGSYWDVHTGWFFDITGPSWSLFATYTVMDPAQIF